MREGFISIFLNKFELFLFRDNIETTATGLVSIPNLFII